ncbi:unnamed protein product [Parajaminaea phylloscopi]
MCNPRPKQIKAIIFDIGGVVVGSPIAGIHTYERQYGLPHDYLNVAITARGQSGAFQRLERSELDLFSFYEQFGRELSDTRQLNEWYTAFSKARGRPLPPNLPTRHEVDGRLGRFKIAALTNNFSPPTAVPTSDTSSSAAAGSSRAPTLDEELEHLGLAKDVSRIRSLFDAYYESSVVGFRKPEAAFYEHALRDLGVQADETVFLDDIGLNLKAAQKMGMRTIRVGLESSLPAIEELERHAGCRLVDDQDRRAERARLADLKPRL